MMLHFLTGATHLHKARSKYTPNSSLNPLERANVDRIKPLKNYMYISYETTSFNSDIKDIHTNEHWLLSKIMAKLGMIYGKHS